MATGRKAFSGASQASPDLLDHDFGSYAPISAVQPMIPPALDRVVRTCLAKDPEDRWQKRGRRRQGAEMDRGGIGGGSRRSPAAVGGDETSGNGSRGPSRVGGRSRRGVAVLRPRQSPPPDELTRFTILPPSGQGFLGSTALSPDARRICSCSRTREEETRSRCGRSTASTMRQAAGHRGRARHVLVARRP